MSKIVAEPSSIDSSWRVFIASRLGGNVVAMFMLQAATLAIPLLSLPYLVRVLGPSAFGRVVLVQAVVHYFCLLTEYGFNLSATRDIPGLHGDRTKLRRLYACITFTKLLLAFGGLAVLAAAVASVPAMRDDWLLYLCAYSAAFGAALFPGWYLQGLQRMQLLMGCMIGAQCLVLLGLLVWVTEPDDYRLAALIQGAGGAVASIIAVPVLARAGLLAFEWPATSEMASALRRGWHVFVSSAATSLYANTNILVLGALASPAAVGYFAVADKLIRALQGVLSAVPQAAYPHLAALKVDSEAQAFHFLRALIQVQVGLGLVASAGTLLVGEWLVGVLFGSDFHPSVVLLYIMSALPVLVGASNVLGIQTMLNFGMERSFSRILLFSGAVNLAMLFALVPMFGATGAALSIAGTELVVVIVMAVALHRKRVLHMIWPGLQS